MEKKKTAIITVTHNSQRELKEYFSAVFRCGIAYEQLILVDAGSVDVAYLKEYERMEKVEVLYEDNVGFCRGNNLGYQRVRGDIDAVLFLNPDIVFLGNILPEALEVLFSESSLFAVSPVLQRCNFTEAGMDVRPELDSTGIFHTWYGRFYDGKKVKADKPYLVPAICGAFMLCRKAYLDTILINGQVFCEKFFMYKEDIELCLRAFHKKKYRMAVLPGLRACHGRGMQDRKKSSPWQRLISVRNEFFLLPVLPKRIGLFAFLYYMIKYLYVRFGENKFF